MSPDVPYAFSLQGICKSFRYFQLDGLNLDLQLGQIMGLVGPNGAGKSTTIRLMMGLISPEAGVIEVLGHRVPEHAAEAKRDMAFVSEDMRLYGAATLAWHMRFVASIYPNWDQVYAQQLLRRFNLRPEQQINGLSRGEHVKSMLLLALARRPRLLILDEPTSGLDPVARHELLTELMDIVRDETRSILFSSHNTLDVERVCDQIAFLDRGHLVAASDKETFLECWRRLSLDIPPGVTLPRLADVVDVSSNGRLATVVTNKYRPEIRSVLEFAGARVHEVQRMSLEEIFVASVMKSREEPAR